MPLVEADEKPRGQDRKPRRHLPRIHDPTRHDRIAREVAAVLNTPMYRCWYEASRCDGAPAFAHYWAYVRESLTYDVPGCEQAGVLWQATARAFVTFDASRGNPATPIEGRFLKHWRYCLANLARKNLTRECGNGGILPELAAGSDPFRELLHRIVGKLVEGLSDDERLLIRLHYWDDLPLGEIARRLGRRKEFICGRHREILAKLKGGL